MELSSKGDRAYVDASIDEMVKHQEVSNTSLECLFFSLYSFGRAAETDKQLKDYRREDLAASLVTFAAVNIVQSCLTIAKLRGIPRVSTYQERLCNRPI